MASLVGLAAFFLITLIPLSAQPEIEPRLNSELNSELNSGGDIPKILPAKPDREAPPLLRSSGVPSSVSSSSSSSPTSPNRAPLQDPAELLAMVPSMEGWVQLKETSKAQTTSGRTFAYGERVFSGTDRKTLIARVSHVPSPHLQRVKAEPLGVKDWKPVTKEGTSEAIVQRGGHAVFEKEVSASSGAMSHIKVLDGDRLYEWWGLQMDVKTLGGVIGDHPVFSGEAAP